jgi:hypothetical protein
MNVLMEIRKKHIKNREDYYRERKRQKENSKDNMCGKIGNCDESNKDVCSIASDSDSDDLYDTLLITGSLDLPGEWD